MMSSESLLQWQYYTELCEILVLTVAVTKRSHTVQVASLVFFGVVRLYLGRRGARTKVETTFTYIYNQQPQRWEPGTKTSHEY